MSKRFKIRQTDIEGLVVLERKLLGDNRGYLERLYCQQELEELLNSRTISQINHTYTKFKGTLRGLHYQCQPHAETKLVSCIAGEVLDIVLDIRQNSPTFLQYHSELITSENHLTMLIPEGFAHGFQTLTDNCEMLYFHTKPHNPESEGLINVFDPHLNISWPLEVTEQSERDRNQPMLPDSFKGVMV